MSHSDTLEEKFMCILVIIHILGTTDSLPPLSTNLQFPQHLDYASTRHTASDSSSSISTFPTQDNYPNSGYNYGYRTNSFHTSSPFKSYHTHGNDYPTNMVSTIPYKGSINSAYGLESGGGGDAGGFDYIAGDKNSDSMYHYKNIPNSGYDYFSPPSSYSQSLEVRQPSYANLHGASPLYTNENYGTQASASHLPFRTFHESRATENDYDSHGHGGSSYAQSPPVNQEQRFQHSPSSLYHHHPSSPEYNIAYSSSSLSNSTPDYGLTYDLIHTNPLSTPLYKESSYPSGIPSSSSSKPPPKSFLKSIFNGITSSMASSLKPVFGFSEPWKPLHLQNDEPSQSISFQQDDPQGEYKSSKSVKHIYIHSTIDKLPQEVNLKLILTKPGLATTLINHPEAYHEDNRIEGRKLGVGTLFPAFTISDLKRSKINAQLYFVRYKSPSSFQ